MTSDSSMRPVYITHLSALLPNAPVGNERMEAVLGQVGERPSRARAIVLRSNGIRNRHYVIDEAGTVRYSNARLTAEAVRGLGNNGFRLDQIELLACGTSIADQIVPNHGVMVHGELGIPTCEVMAAAGVCVSGVMSLKYAWLSVTAGVTRNAVATGSEVASLSMRAHHFEAENEARISALEKRPGLAFEKDFLRWMLSDGAGAALLRDHPNPAGLSLRIEWIDQFSYANEYPVCMFAGGEKGEDGQFRSWREFGSMREVAERSVMAVKQDVRLLDSAIPECCRRGFADMLARRKLPLEAVDWFLPHYSSEYFRSVMYDVMPAGWKIPYERWFTNLTTVGNVGSASMYLMLEELMRGGALRSGQRILCFVPESGRFSAAFVYLTVVGPA